NLPGRPTVLHQPCPHPLWDPSTSASGGAALPPPASRISTQAISTQAIASRVLTHLIARFAPDQMGPLRDPASRVAWDPAAARTAGTRHMTGYPCLRTARALRTAPVSMSAPTRCNARCRYVVQFITQSETSTGL